MSDEAPFLHVRLSEGIAHVAGAATQRLGQANLPEGMRTGQDVFGEWHWDGSQVTVRNCRFGFFPLFYYATADEFGVSNSVQRLIECGAPADLDEAAFATFLRLGWVVGNDTVFRAIRMVPPSGAVRWEEGKTEVAGRYSFPKAQCLPRKDAIEGFGELFRQAVRRRVSRDVPFAMPLSGGRDSRHILLALNAIGCRPGACFTTHDYPPYREGNIRVAAMLCSRLGIPHHVVRQPSARLTAEIAKNRCASFGALEHAWGIRFFEKVSRASTLFFDGLAGDALATGAYSYLKREDAERLERGETAMVAQRVIDYWSWPLTEETLARILPEQVMRRFPKELAVRRIEQELANHMGAAIPLGSFNFWNRTRRCAALGPFAVAARTGMLAVTPFLDHDLFDFMASLPAAMLTDKTFHTETMHRMYPEFREIPFSDALGMPRIERPWHYRRLLAEASGYLAWNGRGKLLRRGRTIRRLLALLVSDGDNLYSRATHWIAPLHIVYLTQLEALCRGNSSLLGKRQEDLSGRGIGSHE